MSLLRHMISGLLIALFVAAGFGNVAMAANDIGHQQHCVDAYSDSAEQIATKHSTTHTADHNGMMAQHTVPDHDHDGCMMHACPALSADAVELGQLYDTVATKLSWPEKPLVALQLADGLKRPPKS